MDPVGSNSAANQAADAASSGSNSPLGGRSCRCDGWRPRRQANAVKVRPNRSRVRHGRNNSHLSLVGIGEQDSLVDAAESLVQWDRTVEPDPAHVDTYKPIVDRALALQSSLMQCG